MPKQLDLLPRKAYPFTGVLLVPKKISVKRAASAFRANVDEIRGFFHGTRGLNDAYHDWCADYAVIRLYLEFESLVLKALVGAINGDTSTLLESSAVKFPKHLSEDVCTYLVVGTGYFDFKGRSGLLRTVQKFVPTTHYLYLTLKAPKYKTPLEQLSTLRNFAAHRSTKAKKIARDAIGSNLSSPGSWLRVQDRFEKFLLLPLTDLAKKIEQGAPF